MGQRINKFLPDGKEGKYDLRLADPPQITESETESESEEDDGVVNPVADVIALPDSSSPAPTKWIRSALIRFLRYFSVSFGLNADTVQKEAALNFSLFLRDLVQSGFRGFAAADNSNKVSDEEGIEENEEVCVRAFDEMK